MDKNIKLSLSQLSKMKHAVGLNNINKLPKDRKYSAYRNFYGTQKEDVDWEELVKMGLATRRFIEWNKEYIYYVSQAGLDYLGQLFGLTIKEMK